MPIRVLPQTVINQIAAGEVIVRMASAVKELAENSIDAGATRIVLRIENDVRDLDIRDDGCGMGRDDAELSLQRHATSKIRTIEDLTDLETRGFRGEALASIAAVSRMELHTRERGAAEGTRIAIEGGVIHRIEPIGCPEGTRIVVRDLFYNTPARLKFLKTPPAELQAVLAVVTRQALAVPHVGFRVEREGDELLDWPPGQTLAERYASVLGSALRESLEPIHSERHGIVVDGFIGAPSDSRADRRLQFFFVNGRPFSNKSLSAALEQAFHGFLMVHRHPLACVFVEVPAGDVDYNVHPTKEEVRFRDERAIASAVYHAAKNAVQRIAARGVNVSREAAASATGAETQQSFVPPAAFVNPEKLLNRAFDRVHQRDWLLEARRAEVADQRSAEEYAPAIAASPRVGTSITARHADASPISAGAGERPDDAFWSQPFDAEPLGQIANTYLFARYGEDLLAVDQHAAHERLVYMALTRRSRAREQQLLLVPPTIDVPADRAELLRESLPLFAELGFELEPFGPRTWSVRAVPADCHRADAVALVLDLLEDFERAPRGESLELRRERILVRAACHGAIRAGQALPLEFQRELLRQMRAERLSFTCPHGRPTIVRVAKGELDRWFKRVV